MEKSKGNTESVLHPRNRFRNGYHFPTLLKLVPDLQSYVTTNKEGKMTVDFFQPTAVKLLNQALLLQEYQLEFWDLPDQNLCPAVPGRADYIHYVADLMKEKYSKPVESMMDIGTGANCIYPIIAVKEFGWNCLGVDIDEVSVKAASYIVQNNKSLRKKIDIRKQENPNNILLGILQPEEYIDVTVCNPPFFSSEDEAKKANTRKIRNLSKDRKKQLISNFQGKHNELWCDGGEKRFILDMIHQSQQVAKQFGWFTTLVSKAAHIPIFQNKLASSQVQDVEIIEMAQGNKKSRILAWTYQEK